MPGGFVPSGAIVSPVDLQECAFCFSMEPAWFHVATGRLVCRLCLPDPTASDGEAGCRAGERVSALEDEIAIW